MERTTGPQSAASEKPAARADSGTDLTGTTFGDYRILRRLGEGGMGQVYLAEQKSLNRKVALKLLRPDLAANKTALARFEAEAKAVAQATHANIVQVYAFGEIDHIHYMALEYVEGRNLRQFLEKKGPPELMLALSIIRQVAAALQRASELGIIHRDIKPENILLTRKGEVKVADFGLSRIFGEDRQPLNLTQSGVTMGTPLYMSPEQVEGKPVDPRTDIYSFGVTCYHLLTGQPPFRGQTAFEVAVQHVQNDPVPLSHVRPDLPPALCKLIHRMMAKDPDDRIQTGREIVRELVRLRDSLVGAAGGSGAQRASIIQMGPVPAEPEYDAVLTQSMPLPRPRSHLRWLAYISVPLALAAGLAYGWWQVNDQPARLQSAAPDNTQPVVKQEPLLEVPPPPKDSREAVPVANREEQELKAAIEKYNRNNVDDIRLHIKYSVDLGLLYVKEGRLSDAEDVFKGLVKLKAQDAKSKFHTAHLGNLGLAIVSAFRGQPKDAEESVKAFRSVLITNRPKIVKDDWPYSTWNGNPAIAEMVARALDHDVANLPASVVFPEALQRFRSPPAAKVRARRY